MSKFVLKLSQTRATLKKYFKKLDSRERRENKESYIFRGWDGDCTGAEEQCDARRAVIGGVDLKGERQLDS